MVVDRMMAGVRTQMIVVGNVQRWNMAGTNMRAIDTVLGHTWGLDRAVGDRRKERRECMKNPVAFWSIAVVRGIDRGELALYTWS